MPSRSDNHDFERGEIRDAILSYALVITATDANARNHALLHGGRGVSVAPFYNLLRFLLHTDEDLRRVNLR